MISRRGLLAGSAVLALPAGYAFVLEPRWLEVRRIDFPVAGLPDALEGVRVAQLSDIHLRGLHAAARAVIAAIEEDRPEIVVFTGDAIQDAAGLETLARFTAAVRGTLATVAILGNWEHWSGVPVRRLRRLYAEAGAELLVNEARVVRSGGASLAIVGLDDALAGRPDPAVARRGIEGADASIWLLHAPGVVDIVRFEDEDRVVLVLAGHTHGGQVRVGPIHTTPPGSGRFFEGWYGDAPAPLYVSRGIGTSVLPARFMCRPEMPIFTLRRG